MAPTDRPDPESDSGDDALLAELRQVLARTDAVPPEAVAAGKASFTWRTVDAELAELTFDSLVDDDLALVRSRGGSRFLSFEAADLSVEIEVVGTGADRRIVGQLVPPMPAAIEIRGLDRSLAAEADDLGRFASAGLWRGPLSLRVNVAVDDRNVILETEWVAV
jgi:hypothetical protein